MLLTLVRDAHAARALAEDGDVVPVAADAGDVAVHPVQRRLLVGEAEVADAREAVCFQVVGNGFGGEEAEEADAVVDCDADDWRADRGRVVNQFYHVVAGVRRGAEQERAAVDPDHDGEVLGL